MAQDHVDRILNGWHEEHADLRHPAVALHSRIRRLQLLSEQAVRSAQRQFDLTPGELDVLASLRQARPDFCLTPTELFRSMILTSGAMTNRLKRLEARGLIERLPDPQDGRSLRVRLSEAGYALIEASLQVHKQTLTEFYASLDECDQQHLNNLLRPLLMAHETQD